ncbi:MAG: ferritin-like domain-containing protein [Myxococcales bacterium]|nr:ferritin-like domain-containing protein [Myxococcales bacterium]
MTAKKRAPKHEASDSVRGEWLRRVEAEYRSAAITQHLGLWLLQIGASPDLVKLAMRIASDEVAHADLSFRCYGAAGGESLPHIPRETLELSRTSDPLELDVLRVVVDVFCIGETIAVPLFKNLREHCTVSVAKRVLDRVLRDEVRHRDFGWTALTWLLEEHPLQEQLRAVVAAELPLFFRRIRGTYAPPGVADIDAISPKDRAWGLMAPARYGAVVTRTLERDWVPRFKKLGFDARAAWGG